MSIKDIKLTETEIEAIRLEDSNYINSKGAKCYGEKKYLEAVLIL